MSSTRYSPNAFQYNGRVALALVPSLCVAGTLGGPSVTVTLAVGAMVSYMMDMMQYREGAFTCSWLTLGFSNVAFTVAMAGATDTHPLMLMPVVFAYCALSALVGMWVSLQFKWIQMQYPPVTLIFERVVLTASLPTAAIMYTLGLASIVDTSDVPYYLAVLLGAMYYGMGRPLPSSFQNPKAAPSGIGGAPSKVQKAAVQGGLDEGTVQGKLDGFCMAALTVGLPPAMYAAIHWVVLLRHMVHVYSLVLLVSLPLLYVSLLPQGLWWMKGKSQSFGFTHKAVITIALVGALVGFEGRVVFHAFGQYIKLHPPWNWIAVTIGLFGFAAVTMAHMAGALGESVDVTLAGSFLLLCTTAGALAMGVPMVWLPAPLVGAGGLALFYDSQSLREYIVFTGGAFMTCVWFMQQHFWFLDITIGGIDLHLMCKLVLGATVPALLVPGLVHAQSSKTSIGLLLIFQASLICVLEDKLYCSSHEDFAGEVMYPGFLVLATTGAGVLAARRLVGLGHISEKANWILHSIYSAKLSMLVLPEASLVAPTIILVLAATAPLFLYQHATSGRRRLRLANWQALTHTVTVLLAVLMARFALFDLVQFLLAARPSEGILMGALLMLTAASLAPLVFKCYPNNQVVVRSLAILVMSGVLLIVLQPPLPLRGGARCPQLPLSLCPRLWDERHVPMHNSEDVEVWGRGLARKEHWPRWLLVAATVLGMAASMLGGPMARSKAGRALLSMAAGFLVGSYVALELVPGQIVLQVLLLLSTMLVVSFVVGLQLPSAKGSVLLPFTAFAWAVLFGLTMLLQTEISPPEPPAEMKRLFPDSKMEVELEIFMAARASLLGVFAAHALLMAFTLKLRCTAALKQQDAKLTTEGHDQALYTTRLGGVPISELFCGLVPSKVFDRFRGLLQMEGSGGLALQRLHREGLAWVPTTGNILTVLCFVLVVSVNMYLTGGRTEAIFMLSPLLLLLSQDPVIFSDLTDSRRYFPTVAVTTAYLAVTAIIEIVSGMAAPTFGLGPLQFSVQSPAMAVGAQLALAALPLPIHLMFISYLWTQKPGKGSWLLFLAPFSLLPVLLSTLSSARYLAVVALFMALTQLFSMKHHRVHGQKLI